MDNIESITVSCHIFHFAAMNVKEYCSGMNLHAELLNDIAAVRMSLANYQIYSVLMALLPRYAIASMYTLSSGIIAV